MILFYTPRGPGESELTEKRSRFLGHLVPVSSEEEAMMAYENNLVGMHTPIHVRVFKEKDGVMQHKTVRTTVGRIIYNGPIPQDLGFVDRSDPEKFFDYEIGFKVDKKKLSSIVDRCIARHGFTRSTEVLDAIKAMGFKYATLGAITISISVTVTCSF